MTFSPGDRVKINPDHIEHDSLYGHFLRFRGIVVRIEDPDDPRDSRPEVRQWYQDHPIVVRWDINPNDPDGEHYAEKELLPA